MNNFNHFLELLFVFTQKEIKARYKHAILGFLWIFINPLIQMTVIGFVFSMILRIEIENYYLFLFTGLLPWNFFSLAINKATPSIVYDRDLIQKSPFPREIIPLSIVFSHLVYFLASCFLLIIFLIITGNFSLFQPINFLFFLLAILLLSALTSGVSLLTSSLTVFYRDINFVTQAALIVWFYITPIIYPLSIIPSKIQSIFYLNPLTSIFSLFQKAIIGQEGLPLAVLVLHTILILTLLIVGSAIFKIKSRYFSDWL